MTEAGFSEGIPAHYTRNGKAIWYEILLKNGEIKTAFPSAETRNEILIDWVVASSRTEIISDEQVSGWKMIT